MTQIFSHPEYKTKYPIFLKKKHNSFEKWPLNLWWILKLLKKIIMEVANIAKAATFKSFLHLSY